MPKRSTITYDDVGIFGEDTPNVSFDMDIQDLEEFGKALIISRKDQSLRKMMWGYSGRTHPMYHLTWTFRI